MLLLETLILCSQSKLHLLLQKPDLPNQEIKHGRRRSGKGRIKEKLEKNGLFLSVSIFPSLSSLISLPNNFYIFIFLLFPPSCLLSCHLACLREVESLGEKIWRRLRTLARTINLYKGKKIKTVIVKLHYDRKLLLAFCSINHSNHLKGATSLKCTAFVCVSHSLRRKEWKSKNNAARERFNLYSQYLKNVTKKEFELTNGPIQLTEVWCVGRVFFCIVWGPTCMRMFFCFVF